MGSIFISLFGILILRVGILRCGVSTLVPILLRVEPRPALNAHTTVTAC